MFKRSCTFYNKNPMQTSATKYFRVCAGLLVAKAACSAGQGGSSAILLLLCLPSPSSPRSCLVRRNIIGKTDISSSNYYILLHKTGTKYSSVNRVMQNRWNSLKTHVFSCNALSAYLATIGSRLGSFLKSKQSLHSDHKSTLFKFFSHYYSKCSGDNYLTSNQRVD